MQGFQSFPQPIRGDKVRGKPERFAEHYNQATLFWNSQTPVEKAHIVRGFRFELTKVEVKAIRERVVATLANVAAELAEAVAKGLGIPVPAPLPRALDKPLDPEVEVSGALSLFARPGDGSIRTRRVAILVADGLDAAGALVIHAGLAQQGAVPKFIGVRLGRAEGSGRKTLDVEVSFEAAPSVVFDAMVIPDGADAAAALAASGQALEFVKDQYRHCKPILALGTGRMLLEQAGIPEKLSSGDADPGVLRFPGDSAEMALPKFVEAISKHRHFAREMDPPLV
jgi:catalase